jgi:signal transduction histidine kinase
MSPKTKAQVYKPFFTTKESTGTGLGLWISEEIVHRHNGSISVKSTEVKGLSGTTFSLLLPHDGTVGG